MKTQVQHGDTTTLPVFDWSTWPGELEGPKGIGKIYRAKDSHGTTLWIYESPKGWQHPVNHYGPDFPPLTRTPKPVRRGRCGCGEYHHCSQCGEQTWVELHGVADGYCTFCYCAG